MSAASRLSALLAVAEHPATGQAEAHTALAGARSVAQGLPEGHERDAALMRVWSTTVSVGFRGMNEALAGLTAATKNIRDKVAKSG